MNFHLTFIRIFFAIISIFFITTFMLSRPEGTLMANGLIGVLIGALFTLFLIGFDFTFRKFNLRSFNIVIIGLFIGYLMGRALVLIFDVIINISSTSIEHDIFVLSPHLLEIIKIALFLFGTYLGSIMTLRSSDELYVSIPFIKFSPSAQKKKDLLIDASVLADARIFDLCSTGILDKHLVIPRFIIKELYALTESMEEAIKSRARQCLETIKQLEQLQNLEIRFNDTDFPEVKDIGSKITRLARLVDANILTADINRAQMSSIEGLQVVNIHSLSNALKPLMETGELVRIKVQRHGKEPRQGVGYLDDGTMVVINGGGNFIGEVIDAQVLSVKHTSSGRMIFCNTIEEHMSEDRGEDRTNRDFTE